MNTGRIYHLIPFPPTHPHTYTCIHTSTPTHSHPPNHPHSHMLSNLLAGSVLQHYETELHRLKSEFSGLSGTRRQELEDMLMEGDLLEVTLDEVQQLWQLLQSDAEFLAAFEGITSGGKSGGEVDEEEEAGGEKEVGVCHVLSVSVCTCSSCIVYSVILAQPIQL